MANEIQKIREVVEKRYEYWKEKEFNSHSIESEIRMSECQHLLLMVNSMQEEPKKCMYSKDNYTDEDRKVLCEDCKEKCAYAIAGVISTNAQVKEEPVSDDLEGEINRYLSTWSTSKDNGIVFCEKMARHFAAWQKEQLMAKAVDGVVHRFDGCGVASVHYNDPNGIPMAYFIPSEGLSAGDKVKIITIKEE